MNNESRHGGDFIETDRPDLSVGRINSDLPKSCQSPRSKIFRFTMLEIRIITSPVSRPQEGRIMIVTTRGARDAVDAFVQARVGAWTNERRRTAKSCGPGAAMLASSCAGNIPRSDGGKQARSPGRARSK